MVQVRISETYDLSTKTNKMGIVGIHTPTGSLIDRLWPGLVLQTNKFRFVKCDVAMACASILPADPLQVGVEAGDIAPQDMFNPILYKAVSNDSMTNFQSWLAGQSYNSPATSSSSLSQGSIIDINDATFTDTAGGAIDQFDLYYALLANPDGFKKAMPQAGLTMRGLYPLVYQVVTQYGDNQSFYQSGDFKGLTDINAAMNSGENSSDVSIRVSGSDESGSVVSSLRPIQFRGPAMRMPAINTTCFVNGSGTGSGAINNRIVPASNQAFVNSNVGQVPPAYVGLIILPPAKLNQLYYRLKVTWTIEFTGLRAMSDINNFTYLSYLGQVAYGTDYAEQSQSMSVQTSMVDASEASVQKIMEGAS